MAIHKPSAQAGAMGQVGAKKAQRVDGIRPVATLLAVVFLLGGCNPFGGDTSETSEQPPSRDASAIGPQPASPEAYRQLLVSVGKPVGTALSGLTKAKTITAVMFGVVRAERVSGQAAERLGQAAPPEDVRAEHADLVQAFKQLNGDLGVLRDAVEARELCASSVVMARVGKLGGLAAVRDASRALAAKGRLQGYDVGLVAPSTPKEQNRRLGNGQFVRPGSRTGRGELKVDNGGSQDAVITLALGKRPAFSVYVRKHSKYTVTGIRDGTYRVYYTLGSDWDHKARAFTRRCSFERFDDTFKFKTTQSATEVEWVNWTIALQPVTGGTATTSEVNPKDFPAM